MSSADSGDSRERELKKAESRYDELAKFGGIAVVLGLLIEVVLTVRFPKGVTYLERWGPVFADALIALGVTGEVIFAARARSKAEALKVISDQKVVGANTAAAQAHERAAALEKEAAEARERTAEIEKLTAWRRISPEQHSSISVAIRDAEPKITLRIEYQSGDMEAFMYARGISRVLEQSGATTAVSVGTRSSFTPGAFGVRVASAPEININSIVEAFEAAGIDLRVDEMPHLPSGVQPNLYVFVAPRPPPDFDLPI
jgi:hypothetical protein